MYFFSKKSSPTRVPYLNPAPGLENINIAQVAKLKRTHYDHIKQAIKAYTVHTEIEPNLFQKIEKLSPVKSSSPTYKYTKVTNKLKIAKPNALQHQCEIELINKLSASVIMLPQVNENS